MTMVSPNREVDAHLFGENQALSPQALQADFIDTMRTESLPLHQSSQNQIDTVERSQLYETGQQSEALRSISRAQQSSSQVVTETQEMNSSRSPDFEHPTDQSSSQRQHASAKDDTLFVVMQETNQQLNDSKTVKEQTNRTQTLTSELSQRVIRYNHLSLGPVVDMGGLDVMATTCLTSERKSERKESDKDNESEVKKKITLNYEKIELEKQLADMANTILNFKNQYGTNGSLSSPPSASRASKRLSSQVENTKSKKSVCSPRSGEHSPRQKAQAHKECQKQQQKRVSYTMQGELPYEVTLVNSETEQTFRGPNAKHKQTQPKASEHSRNNVRVRDNLLKQRSYDELMHKRRELVDSQDAIRQQQQKPYDQFVRDLEAETRAEVRHLRFQDTSRERIITTSRSAPRNSEHDESQEPLPQPLPRLLVHDTSTFDGRYFAAMSPTSTSGALISQRTGQTSFMQQEKSGNLVSCLRLSKQNVDATMVSSARGSVAARLSPHRRLGKSDSHQVKSFTRPNSYTQTSGFFGDTACDQKNFKEIMSPSDQSYRNRQNRNLSLGTMGRTNGKEKRSRNRQPQVYGVPATQIDQHQKPPAKNGERRRVRNINGFDLVKQMNDQFQQLQQSKSGTQLLATTERSRQNIQVTQPSHAPQSSGLTGGPSHNTHRSMGIESFCQRQQLNDVGTKMGPAAQYQARDGHGAGTEFNVITEIQERSENFIAQLSHRKRDRQEVEDRKNELLGLRGEKKLLKMQLEQKDLALEKLRDENADQKKEIAELKEKLAVLQKEVDIAGDQELFRKFKEVLSQKEEIANKLASTEFSTQANQKSHDLMKRSYESLKQNQLELVEMNKNLLARHHKETEKLEEDLAQSKQLLTERTKKLTKYSEVIKSFDEQIQAFEAFQQKTLSEMSQLQSQVLLFQGLFEREKLEKEELVQRLRPSQRPIHDSLRKQLEGKFKIPSAGVTAFEYESAGGHEWERKVHMHNSSKDGFQPMGMPSTDKVHETTNLTQTMSKNLSFGQPFLPELLQMNTIKSSKGQMYHEQYESGGGNIRNFNELPLQILSETSSEKIAPDSAHHQKRSFSQDSRPNEAYVSVQEDQNEPPPVQLLQRFDSARIAQRGLRSPGYQAAGEDNQPSSVRRPMYHQAIASREMPPRPDRSKVLQPRSSSQNLHVSTSLPQIGTDNSVNMKYSHVTQGDEATAMHQSTDYVTNNLDESACNLTENLQQDEATAKQLKNFATLEHDVSDRRDKIASSGGSRHLNSCASATVYKRKLTFNKPRPASSASNKQGLNTSNTRPNGSKHQTSQARPTSTEAIQEAARLTMLSPKDYYCRLKEMQRRLDRARNEISRNVSRSRSKSPVTNTSTAMPQPFEQVNQSIASYSLISNPSQSFANHVNVSRNSNTSQKNQQTAQPKQYKPYIPMLSSSIPRNSSQQPQQNGSSSNERRKEALPLQRTSSKTRPQAIKSSVISSSQQKFVPLFYTSLYNGVQPLYK